MSNLPQKKKFNVSVILGIRPDYIRTSEVLRLLKSHQMLNTTFISTGQHYDHELKGVFLEELNLPEPDITLDSSGDTHCEQHSKLIAQLEKALLQTKPDVCVFLGDANAVIGCIVPLKLGVPIAHIEAGMRSFDWRMPEERNRVVIDRVSDVLYVYHENYKGNLIREGVNPSKIVTVGNVIVDVLQKYKTEREARWPQLKEKFGLKEKNYAVMTMHRSENVSDRRVAQQFIDGVYKTAHLLGIPKIILPVMPRLKDLSLNFYDRFITTQPMGFFDFTAIEENAQIEFTDSGTNQETSAILGTPCVVLRQSTERPETFMSGISAMAPVGEAIYNSSRLVLSGNKNEHFSLGDGRASEKIVGDLLARLALNMFFNAKQKPWVDMEILSHFA